MKLAPVSPDKPRATDAADATEFYWLGFQAGEANGVRGTRRVAKPAANVTDVISTMTETKLGERILDFAEDSY
jgi:hypothetical protein